jgi:hypothetical protein
LSGFEKGMNFRVLKFDTELFGVHIGIHQGAVLIIKMAVRPGTPFQVEKMNMNQNKRPFPLSLNNSFALYSQN